MSSSLHVLFLSFLAFFWTIFNHSIFLFYFLSSSKDIFFIAFRERVTSVWDRNIDWWPPIWTLTGIEPATWTCARTGNQIRNISVCGSILQATEPRRARLIIPFLFHCITLLILKCYTFCYAFNGYLGNQNRSPGLTKV